MCVRERDREREMTGEMDRGLAYGEIDAVDEQVLIVYRSETKGTPHASENFWCLSTVESSRVARHSQVEGGDQTHLASISLLLHIPLLVEIVLPGPRVRRVVLDGVCPLGAERECRDSQCTGEEDGAASGGGGNILSSRSGG